MNSFLELRNLIDEKLNKINYAREANSLYDPVEYILSLKAKRIRPILLLMAHQLYNNNLDKAIYPAIGVEIFHNFTLLHDDIMDHAIIRRGFKTVHEKWNLNTAILSGDAMLIKSYQSMMCVESKVLKNVLEIYNEAAVKVCIGQQWDMDFENSKFVEIEDYIKMIEYKTAILIAASLKIGGITGGADVKNQELLYDFGKNIGIAFQLKDDLLDTFGDEDIFGKETGGDIKSNKKTFLYLKALSIANNTQKMILEKYFEKNIADNKEKIKNVKKIFLDLKIPQITNELIYEYHSKAIKSLDCVEASDKKFFYEFSKKLLDRIN